MDAFSPAGSSFQAVVVTKTPQFFDLHPPLNLFPFSE